MNRSIAQLLRFAGVGTGATVLQGLIYSALCTMTSGALALSLVISTLAATATHARVTFDAQRASLKQHAFSLVLLVLTYLTQDRALQAGAALGLTSATQHAVLLVFISALIGIARFFTMRAWFTEGSS